MERQGRDQGADRGADGGLGRACASGHLALEAVAFTRGATNVSATSVKAAPGEVLACTETNH